QAVGATIGGQLSLRGASLVNPEDDALSLDGATITGGVFMDGQLVAEGNVRLIDTCIGSLHGPSTGIPAGRLFASGLRVSHLYGAIATDTEALISWLNSTPVARRFDPDPWFALANVYEDHGNIAGATTLRHEATRRTADASTRRITRVSGRVYDLVAGHGYRPLRTAAWLLVVFVATAVFIWGSSGTYTPVDPVKASTAAEAHRASDPHAALPAHITGQTRCDLLQSPTASYPCFTPGTIITLAAANTLPLPASAFDWRTTNDWITLTLLVLRTLSWIAAAILIAAASGLLKKTS
ncbi:hypothetical protein, partial [Williamsia sterculiae]